MRRIHFALAPCLLILGLAQPLYAEPSVEEKAAARALVVEGRALLDQGEDAQALAKLEKAHGIMGVPSTGYDVARALAKVGKLVEALGMARQVTQIPVQDGEPEAYPWARAEAAKLITALGPRIPRLRIRVEGAEGQTVEVTVDDQPVSGLALEMPRIVNPGSHEVVARVRPEPGGGEAPMATQQITIAEGQEQTVVLSLRSAPAPPMVPSWSTPVAPPPSVRPPLGPHPQSDTGGPPVWAWVSGGVGIALTAVAIGMAVDLADVQSIIGDDCAETNSRGEPVCDPSRYSLDEAEALYVRRDRAVGLTAGFGAAGLIAVGIGLYGIVAGSSTEPDHGTAEVTPAVWLRTGSEGGVLGVSWRW